MVTVPPMLSMLIDGPLQQIPKLDRVTSWTLEEVELACWHTGIRSFMYRSTVRTLLHR